MIDRLKQTLSESKNIVVTAHLNPDGDAVGSALALSGALKNSGKAVQLILPNKPSPNLRVVQGYDTILFYTTSAEQCDAIIEQADVIFCLDFNNIEERLGNLREPVLKNSSATKVLVDHHKSPPVESYDILFSDVTKSSTSLMVAELIEQLGMWQFVEIGQAEALYLGMMTDTGNFTFGNLNAQLFEMVAKVVAVGVQPNVFYSKIFDTMRESQIRLRAYALSEKMIINPELKCGYMTLSREELERFEFVEGDLEGLVNVPLSIEGIENSAIFIEKRDLVKISLRSLLSGIDVDQFARAHYIGGGHVNAAGGKFYGTIEDAAEIYVKELTKMAN